jgi:hypothetical protein
VSSELTDGDQAAEIEKHRIELNLALLHARQHGLRVEVTLEDRQDCLSENSQAEVLVKVYREVRPKK